MTRWSYDGTELAITDPDVQTAQVTTRDIDRGEYPHFLLKEITASPASFRKTLRGKLIEDADGIRVRCSATTRCPPPSMRRTGSGSIDRVLVIGQGTAAIAGQSLAHHLGDFLAESEVRVEAVLATELSGFQLRSDMSDTLVVAISQSGTTTDTNRTVDLVRARAPVVAIVNRRGSDLTDKADGVLYTSDGRDVEMSVASTKAFYSQVAAGTAARPGDRGPGPGWSASSSPTTSSSSSGAARAARAHGGGPRGPLGSGRRRRRSPRAAGTGRSSGTA